MDMIPMDNVGYQRLLLEIEKERETLSGIQSSKAEQLKQCHSSDAVMDNPIISQIASQERQSKQRLQDLLSKRDRAQIIEPAKAKDTIGFGSLVKVLFLDETNTPTTVKVVSNSPMEGEVSLQSPMGGALYGKRVGDVANYTVGNSVFQVKVLSID